MGEKQDLFSLPTGSVLQIQATVPDDAPRYSVRLIGSLPGANAIAQTNDMPHLRFDLTIGNVSEEVSLLAEVRNIAERPEDEADSERLVRFYGLQFGTLSRYQQVLLNAWVTNQELRKTLRAQHA